MGQNNLATPCKILADGSSMVKYEGPSIFSTEIQVFLLANRVGSNTNVDNNVLDG